MKQAGSCRKRAWSIAALACLTAAIVGCSSSAPESDAVSTDTAEASKQTQVERGPVRVTVKVSPHPARLSDEPELRLIIDAQAGVDVKKPPFGEALGEFVIRNFRSELPKVSGDRVIHETVYTLEPMRTGQLQIDPITVRFTDNRPDGDGKDHTVETEALAIEVTSVLDSEAPSLDQLHGFAPPVELPPDRIWWQFWVLGAVLMIGGAAGLYWQWRRRRVVAEEQRFTPQELAWLELERILEAGLIDSDIKEFYVELTGVVRRYIERSTGVHAPEQTTEEFLREIQGSEKFDVGERGRLRDFLESADLVKFAAHQPQTGDIEQTFELAKRFIGLDQRQEETV